MRTAQLSILRTRISACLNTMQFEVNLIATFPRQANNTLPYIKILTTKELTSYTLTLTFPMLNIRALALIQLKACFALLILLYKITSGLLLLFESYIPKYLNSFTVFKYLLLHTRFAAQFTNMHSVFSVFISRLFISQNF